LAYTRYGVANRDFTSVAKCYDEVGVAFFAEKADLSWADIIIVRPHIYINEREMIGFVRI